MTENIMEVILEKKKKNIFITPRGKERKRTQNNSSRIKYNPNNLLALSIDCELF